MKTVLNLSLLLLLVLLCGTAQSQNIPQNPNVTDSQGKRQGKWTILYDANWNVITEADKASFYRTIEYKDDTPIGVVKDHYQNGVVQMEATLLADRPNDMMDGLVTFYRPDKTIEKTQVFEKGVLKEETLHTLDGSPIKNDWATLDSLGKALVKQRDYAKAYELFNKSKALAEKEFGKKHQNYVLSLKRLADLFGDVAQYPQAESLYLEAMNIQKEIKGDKDTTYARIINNLGILYYRTGNFVKTETLWTEALNIVKLNKNQNEDSYADYLANLGVLYYDKGNYAKAEEYYLEAMQIIEKLYSKKSPRYAYYLGYLGNLSVEKSKYTDAMAYFEEAIEIQKESNDNFYPFSIGNLAMVYMKLEQYGKAKSLYEQALEIHKNNVGTKHPNYAKATNDLAEVHKFLYQFDTAKELILESLKIQEETTGKQHPQYANALKTLALLYTDMGDYPLAEATYLEVLDIQKTIFGEKHFTYAYSLGGISNLYILMDNFQKAEIQLLKVLEIIKNTKGEDQKDYAGYLSNLGVLYADNYNHPKAEECYLKALAIREKILGKESLDYANSLITLGNFYGVKEDYTKAEGYFKESMEIFEKIGLQKSLDYAKLLSSAASVAAIQNDFERFTQLSKQALSLSTELLGENHINHLRLKLAFFQRMVFDMTPEMIQKEKKLNVETSLLDLLQQLESKLGKNRIIYEQTLFSIGYFYWRQKNSEEAIKYFTANSHQFLQLLESKSLYMSEKEKQLYNNQASERQSLYAFMISALYVQNQMNRSAWVYDNALNTKSILLNTQNKMRDRILNSGNESLISLYQNWKSQQNLLANVYQMTLEEKENKGINQTQLENSINDIEKELSLQSDLFASLNDKKRYTWQDVQKTLKKGEAAIEIIRGVAAMADVDSVIYLALIIKPDTRKNPEIVVLDNGAELEGKYLRYYYNSIKAEKEDKYSYTQYWEKIKSKLKRIEKVYLSPDGVFNQINLLTLQNPTTKEYLLDEIDLRILDNTKELVLPQKKSPAITNSILVGYPDYNDEYATSDSEQKEEDAHSSLELSLLERSQGETLRFLDGNNISPLPGTQEEVKSLEGIFQKANIRTQAFLKAEATENLIKSLQSPQILHIATHGFFLRDTQQKTNLLNIEQDILAENPLLRSGLLFSGAKKSFTQGGDGILTAQEAVSLNLDNTELVVMSACETGLGEVVNGEGVYGLQRAFRVAGARSILMSLWTVSDDATQELMTLFYQNWITEKQPKREAFRNVQKELRKKYPAPNYWGAFMMIGE